MTEPKWWDATVSQELYTFDQLKAVLDDIAERYVIGREVGKTTGYKHYQVRMVLNVGKTLQTLSKCLPACSLSPTHTKNFAYCEKEGDFYRSWEKGLKGAGQIELMDWQIQAIDKMKRQGDRRITLIFDADGGVGKTTMARYCVARRIATYVPPLERSEDLMSFAMAKPSEGYIFDMPRSCSVKNASGMWSAIEQIKNGYIYDKRYQFRDMWIDPPKIMVFCNDLPDWKALSEDRWDAWQIIMNKFGEYELIKLDSL